MRNLLYLIVGASLLLCCECCRNDKNYYVREPEDYLAITDTVHYEVHKVATPTLLPARMIVTNNHLVIGQNKTELSFCIHELPLGGRSFEAVPRGRGPLELIEPDFKSLMPEKEGFIIADADYLLKYYTISGEDVLLKDKWRFFDSNILNGVIKVGETILNVNIDERDSQPFEFVAMKPDGTKYYLGRIPEWDEEVSNDDAGSFMTYANMHIARPSGGRFAEFYSFWRKVRILDERGNILSETSINYPTSSSRVPPSQGIYCTYGVTPCASDSFIVALAENSFRGKSVPSQQPDFSEFQVWDWDGHLLHRVILKKKMSVFTVDFDSGRLYAMDQENEDAVYSADMSKFLH